jgi:hypothetical protein
MGVDASIVLIVFMTCTSIGQKVKEKTNRHCEDVAAQKVRWHEMPFCPPVKVYELLVPTPTHLSQTGLW